jgi:hypothetical protein
MKNHVKNFHSFSINEGNMNNEGGTMPPGKYWIGDLCYVMNDKWEAACDLMISGDGVNDGVFELPDGTTFASMTTAYGDGTYTDESGKQYPVDAGLIGAIKVDDITSKNADMKLGNVFDFPYEWEFSSENGVLYFDKVRINTGDEEEDYDDPYGNYYNDEDEEDYDSDY